MEITVRAARDPDARVWYVAESSLPGLNVEAESFDALIEQVRCAIQDLLEARGGAGQIDMPGELTAHAQVQIGPRA